MKLMLIIDRTSKQHKVCHRNFLSKFERIRQILEHSYFAWTLLEIFSVDPYY